MKKNAAFYFKLFLSTFTLSAFTVGGGYVIVPLMRRRFVEEYHWIDEDEMIDITAVAQSAPGPIAVNASLLVGYRMAGLPGAAVTILGTVRPPLILLSSIAFFYAQFRESQWIDAVLRGIRAAVAAVMVDAVIGIVKTAFKAEQLFPAILLGIAFILSFFTEAPVALILLGSGSRAGLPRGAATQQGTSGEEQRQRGGRVMLLELFGAFSRSDCSASEADTRYCL
jgi:chromate transporter